MKKCIINSFLTIAILCFISPLFCQNQNFSIKHIVSSDSIDNGKPCSHYNLFPYFMDQREKCILQCDNNYYKRKKIYSYKTGKHSAEYICTLNCDSPIHELYVGFNNDTLYYIIGDSCYGLLHNTEKIMLSNTSKNLLKQILSLQLIENKVAFAINGNNILAYSDMSESCISFWSDTTITTRKITNSGGRFFWISDSLLLYAIPHLEDEHGTFFYELLIFNLYNESSLPLISEKIYEIYDFYNGKMYFLNSDLELCETEIIKKENGFAFNNTKTVTDFNLYNWQIYGLYKLPQKGNFLIIGADDYYLFQID